MSRIRIIVAVCIFITDLLIGQAVQASNTVKFKNESNREIKVSIKDMSEVNPLVYRIEAFSLRAKSEQEYYSIYSCIRDVIIDGRKTFWADNKNSCVSLSAIKILFTIRADGRVDIAEYY